MLFKKNIVNLAKFGNGKAFCDDYNFNKIIFNSKDVKPGDIFLPLKGEAHDGHKFISEAFNLGAICVISENHLPKENYIHVEDTNIFLKSIAKKQRELFKGYVIGITGSNGKTTAKEKLANYLENKIGKTKIFKSYGNYNNFYGLCFSLLKLNSDHEIGCFEIGTSQKGEISNLSQILQMNLSILTNIGEAHLEGLNNLEGVAKEKTDIFKYTLNNGYCFGSIPKAFLHLAEEKSFGKNKNFYDLKSSEDLLIRVLLTVNKNLSIKDESEEDIKNFLNKDVIVPGRFEIKKTKSGAIIIDDSYNANPDSFRYAFKKLKNPKLLKDSISINNIEKYKKVCIMGKMEELGKNSEKLHQSILKEASSIFDMVLALDFLAKLDSPNIKFIKRNELNEELNKYLSESFLVFFKGSRSVKMEEIIKTII